MTTYYAVINNSQIGPVSADELVARTGFTPSTFVWCAGMTDWRMASEVAEIAEKLTCPPPMPEQKSETPPAFIPRTAPQQPQPVYIAMHRPAGADRGRPYNWMGWAITATLVGALFYVIGAAPGVVGIIFSSNAQQKYKDGNFAGAYSDNNVAKVATIIGLCIAGLVILMMVLFILFAVTMVSFSHDSFY